MEETYRLGILEGSQGKGRCALNMLVPVSQHHAERRCCGRMLETGQGSNRHQTDSTARVFQEREGIQRDLCLAPAGQHKEAPGPHQGLARMQRPQQGGVDQLVLETLQCPSRLLSHPAVFVTQG